MLTELQLRNFRCFEDHTLAFKSVVALIGANNAGKSTAIEALRLIALVVNRYGSVNFQDVPPWLNIYKFNRGIAPATSGIEWNTISLFHGLGDPPASIIARFDSGEEIELFVGPEGALHAVIRDSNGKPITTKGQTRDHPLPTMSILPQIGPIAREENILAPDYARRVISSSWASLHFRNQLNLYYEHFDEFRSLSESTWPGLRIRPLEGQGGLPGNQLALLLHDEDFVAEIAWMGHGLQMWLQTMWFLARSHNSDIIILDEPDVYMHADLQRKLIRLVTDRHPQTIIATHSVEIMAELEPSDLLIVNRRSPKSKYATSIPAVQRVVESLGGVHNLQLARLSEAGKCLLVEGKDIPFLEQIQARYFPDTSEPLGIVPNMQIGGWGGWNYAVGSRMLLKNAMGQDVVTYCILDSDYHTSAEIEDRYRDATAKGVQLHIWTKKEIENYFLVPSAIRRTISATLDEDVNPPSEQEIVDELDKIADALKNSIFDALAQEYLARDRAGGASKANKLARTRLEKAYSTFEGKMAIVSGKTALKELSKWSKVNYGVSIGATSISRNIHRDEIDPELSSVIRNIEFGRNLIQSR